MHAALRLSPRTRHFYPCAMTMTIGKPIPTAGLTMRQADELTARLGATIAEMLATRMSGHEFSGAVEDVR